MKRHQNDIQPFERLAFWMNWFDQSFKKNLSVDYRINTKNVKIHVQFCSEFFYVLVHEHLEGNQPKDSF